MSEVPSSTSASFLPSIKMTPEVAFYLKIAGIVMMSLAAWGYWRGRIGAKSAFTAQFLGGGMLVAGFWGVKESRIVSQFVRPALAEIEGQGGLRPKLLLACARYLSQSEAKKLIEKARSYCIERVNGNDEVVNLWLAMDFMPLQHQIHGDTPALCSLKDELRRIIPMYANSPFPHYVDQLSRFVRRMPRTTVYDCLKDDLAKVNEGNPCDKTLNKRSAFLFEVLASALPHMSDVDVIEEYRWLCEAAHDLYIKIDQNGIGEGLTGDLIHRHFSALISCLAALPDEQFTPALEQLLLFEHFNNPTKWPPTDEAAAIVARAPVEMLFNRLDVKRETGASKLAWKAYVKIAQKGAAPSLPLPEILAQTVMSKEVLVSLSELDPSIYRPLLASLFASHNVGDDDDSSIVDLMALILWERGHTCREAVSTERFPGRLKKDNGQPIALLQILKRVAGMRDDAELSLLDLLGEYQLKGALLASPACLGLLLNWIYDPKCYTGDNHAALGKIVEIVLEIRSSYDFPENSQSVCLEIAKRDGSKKIEMIDKILSLNVFASRRPDFLWKTHPTFALEYYLRHEEHYQAKEAVKDLSIFYPFKDAADNALALQLLTKLFYHEEATSELKADILNLLAEAAPVEAT